VLFGDAEYLNMFDVCYEGIKKHLMDFDGALVKNVDMRNGKVTNFWVDSLSAFLPGLQVNDE